MTTDETMTQEQYDTLVYSEVYRLALLGWSARAIMRETTLSDLIVRRVYVSAVVDPEISLRCPCGRPRSHPKNCHALPSTGMPPVLKVRSEVMDAIATFRPWRGGYTPQLIEQVRELIRSGMTHNAACKSLGISGTSILPDTAAVRAEMAEKKRLQPATTQRVPTRIDPAIVPQVEELAYDGMSIKKIAKKLNISHSTAGRYAKPIFARLSEKGELCGCGKPFGHYQICTAKAFRGPQHWEHASGMRPDRVGFAERIRQLALEGMSFRAMARELGASHTSVQSFAMRHQIRLGLAGELCKCGKPRGHMYGCSAFAYRVVDDPAEVDRCVAALEQGLTMVQIVREHGVREALVRITRAKLTEHSQQLRRQAIAERVQARVRPKRVRAIKKPLPASISSGVLAARRDALFAKCSAAIPRAMAQDIRDDAVTELYLAVLEGEVAENEIREKAGKFVNATYSTWASRFGPRSLDAKLSADDDRTAGDFIEDEVALAQFDEIMVGGDW